jgi:hypothetical protein
MPRYELNRPVLRRDAGPGRVQYSEGTVTRYAMSRQQLVFHCEDDLFATGAGQGAF